jgi:hypothetical protein
VTVKDRQVTRTTFLSGAERSNVIVRRTSLEVRILFAVVALALS